MKGFLKQKWHVILYFVFIVMTILIIGVSFLAKEHTLFERLPEERWDSKWKYDLTEGTVGYTELPASLPKVDTDHIILTNTIPKLEKPTSFMFRIRHVNVNITVGGEKRLDQISEMNEINSWYLMPGIYYYEVMLYPEDSGKEIKIESVSSIKRYLFNPGAVYLGDRGTFIVSLLNQQMKTVICALIMFMIAIILFILWLFITFVFKEVFRQILCLSLFTATIACWLVSECQCLQYMFDNTRFASIMAYEMLMLAPVPIALFFSYGGVREKTKKMSNYAAIIPILLFCINNILHFGHIVNLADSLQITQLVLVAEIFFIAKIQVSEIVFIRKSKDIYSSAFWKVPLVGIAFLMPMGILEVIKYAMVPTKYANDGIMISIGVLVYIISLAIDSGLEFAYITLELKQKTIVLQKNTETKTQFLANMSHEIRTPINSILGFDELILREGKDPKIAQYALSIKNASDSLMSIINSILDITKIESGKLEIYSVEYNTVQFFASIISMIGPMAKKKGLQFKVDIDENIPEILIGDENHIRQVLINILTNAVKYTPTGSVTFTVRVNKCSEDSLVYELYFSVKDTGIGIKEEDREKLFEKFERLDKNRNYGTEGTGLGMSIVVLMLKAMDSHIEVDSEYEKGSDFHFLLEQCAVDPKKIGRFEDRLNLLEQNYKSEINYIAPRAVILIVDDVPMNLEVAKDLLERHKMTIDTAKSGKQAVEMIQKKHYNLVLMDHMMPEMDGVQATEAIRDIAVQREDMYFATLPIIALTANAIVGMKETFLQAGMQDFISKPVNAENLSKVIKKWLPVDLVEVIQEDTNQKEDTKEDWEPVPELDMEKAKEFNADEAMFKKNLKSFYQACDSTMKKLCDFKEQEDGENYEIAVHGLKSTSKLIGAMRLSDKALELEMSCKAGKYEEVWQENDALMALCTEIQEIISNFLGIEKEAVGEKMEDMISKEAYRDLILEIKKAADNFDMARFMQYEDELEEIVPPQEKQEEFEQIKEFIRNAAFGDASEYLQRCVQDPL